ncbi:uncharacterized protein EDB91DRAFT_1159138 [Suillus paluster]|uniref:uncharacterized protein n=1 Tax=Suillus paluster TaxID=48578 RepID=UPI001B86DEDF|nr:uncharacterized protein EDB91DRAFT_1159138 [Suillus paluster]KAG1729655.1 hypothetical protein EDB91DRAFT_1159138 [Suillus paluster]
MPSTIARIRIRCDEATITTNPQAITSPRAPSNCPYLQKRYRRKVQRRSVYGYYVTSHRIYKLTHGDEKPGEGALTEPFREFCRTLCEETGLPNDSSTFCQVGGCGYCIALTRNLRKAPEFSNLETLVQKVKMLLNTDEEPDWYYEELGY